jgi:hypothetical protein
MLSGAKHLHWLMEMRAPLGKMLRPPQADSA